MRIGTHSGKRIALAATAAILALASAARARDGQIDIRPTGAATFTISTPGSYILVDNVTMTANVSCITITANDVTLDLNGHTIVGTGVTGGRGIDAINTSRTKVSNGTIRTFFSNGVDVSGTGTGCVVENVTVTGCGAIGIFAGTDARVERCTAIGNNTAGNASGINVGARGVVRDCIANANNTAVNLTSATGISAGTDSLLTGNTCNGNTALGALATVNGIGILAGNGSTITGNTCNLNATNDFNGVGIQAGNGCTISDNTCLANSGRVTGIGISAGSNCLISGNTCSGNTGSSVSGSGSGLGISAIGASVVRNNVCNANVGLNAGQGTGIRAGGAIAGNTCTGNNGGPTNGTGIGIDVGNSDTVVENNVSTANNGFGTGAAIGIRLNTVGRCTLRGNTCSGQVAAATGNSRGIQLAASSNSCTVQENVCNNNTGGTSNVGIFITSGAVGCVIFGNTTSGNTTTGIAFGAAGSQNRTEVNRTDEGAIVNPPTSVGAGDLADITF